MKVTTDACLFGAWVAEESKNYPSGEKLRSKNVLDVGTGTGLLSLMYAQKNTPAIIDAIEIDQAAHEQARENAEASLFAERIYMINADIKNFTFLKKYDCIISNPPFYEKEIASADQKKNIAHHQSALTLADLLNIIKTNLSPDGVFYLMLPFKRNKEIRRMLLKEDLSVSKIVFVRQSTNHDYFRVMIKGSVSQGKSDETLIEEISIWDDRQQYTDEFRQLLQEYYLSV
jgi:tRNA1Val (adenine37-N6)-methyltransferase